MIRSESALLGTCAVLSIGLGASAALAENYDVGPDQTYENILDVPLDSLAAGDVIQIHYREEPYRETFGLEFAGTEAEPIVVRGVRGPNGELPVIDGEGAESGYGAHDRGLIHVDGAEWLTVENLELRNANEENGFPDNASGVYAPNGAHLTFRNLNIHHNGNGFFTWVGASDVLLEGSLVHDNGNEGSIYEHNIYTESNGIVFQYNVMLPLRSGAGGGNLKDRSAGVVIRYNWIEGGNRVLDLVEAEDGDWDHQDDPTFVYGNVLLKHEDTGQSQVVHFGQDNGMTPRTMLYFHHNTVFSDRSDNATLFFLNAPATADVRNNVFFSSTSSLELLDPDDSSQAVLELGVNWISDGYRQGSSDATFRGLDNLIEGSDPGFADAPEDFALLEGSAAIDAGGELASGADGHPADMQFAGLGNSVTREDAGDPDLGAFAFGAGGGSMGTAGGSSTGTGGRSSGAGGGNTGGPAEDAADGSGDDDGGCGCGVPGSPGYWGLHLLSLLGLAAVARRCRRRG